MSQNCKLIKAVPVDITKGKDAIVLSYMIRDDIKIRIINKETFMFFLKTYFFKVYEMGSITKYFFNG